MQTWNSHNGGIIADFSRICFNYSSFKQNEIEARINK